MNDESIKDIVGREKPRKLKKYILTAGGEIIESSKLEYDDFMECYGVSIYNEEIRSETFNVVIIAKESDFYEELENAIKC